MITTAILKSIKVAKRKGWDKVYWAFDIHETIILPNWKEGEIPTEFYPYAMEALKLISGREDIVMILYTCSHPHEIVKYLELFDGNGIHFKYVNENPEVVNMRYGCYDQKFYYNLLFEDKAGFNAKKEWAYVLRLLKKLKYLMDKKIEFSHQ